MKVSLNWVRQFTDVDISVDELVTKIGAQLGAVEEVIDLGKKYQGIVVAKVVSCEKHPNADKLHVCKVDDGGVAQGIERDENGYVQVVCGAPNVREGLTVAWLPPGAIVPSTFDKDPFVLGARELRGEMSNGMLASAQELAIGDDHSGIVELDTAAHAGTDFAEAYGLNDYIIDIENKMFTHRPDCFGLLGVAREVAGIQHKAFTSPEWYLKALDRIKPGKTRLEFTVSNNALELVPRFMAVAVADVSVEPSPFTLQVLLSKVGLRPINNIVDITNYLMYLTGQPTHAYDYDKLAQYGPVSLETRMSRKGDTLTLLNGKKIELQDDSTVLITSNDVPIGIGGCMGGADTEVDETTKNIVLECANFDMYSIRRTSMKYGLFTDAVTRFNKGQSALQNDVVLEELVAMTQSLTGGHVASRVIDEVTETVVPHDSVQVTAKFINERLGSELSNEEITRLLTNVEFEVKQEADLLDITPPYWRTDIQISEDIVEEVGRLYGYDELSLSLPQREAAPAHVNELLTVKRAVREKLASAGANEVLTYGFVHGDLLDKSGQDKALAFKLSNALSPDLQYYRMSLTPSLLDKVHANIKAGHDEFALFEIGKTHSNTVIEEGLPAEFERIALVVAKNDKRIQDGQSAYYQAKYMAEWLLDNNLQYVRVSDSESVDMPMFNQLLAPYEPQRSSLVYADGKLLGVIGEFKTSVKKQLKLPNYTAGFELFTTVIQRLINSDSAYTPLSRFPKTEQDITLRVKCDIAFGDIATVITQCAQSDVDIAASVQPLSIYQKSKKDKHLQVSFRITLQASNRTLTTEAANQIIENIAQEAKEQFDAERV